MRLELVKPGLDRIRLSCAKQSFHSWFQSQAFTDKGLQSQAKMGAVFSVASALLAVLARLVSKMCPHTRTRLDKVSRFSSFSEMFTAVDVFFC